MDDLEKYLALPPETRHAACLSRPLPDRSARHGALVSAANHTLPEFKIEPESALELLMAANYLDT